LTQREEDKRVRRGKDAAKGATVIFWRLAGGDEEELLALRVLLFDLVAIFFEEAKMIGGGLCRWPPNTWKIVAKVAIAPSCCFERRTVSRHQKKLTRSLQLTSPCNSPIDDDKGAQSCLSATQIKMDELNIRTVIFFS
jgi:hypothetical protein